MVPEFKREAACLVLDQGYSHIEAARSLAHIADTGYPDATQRADDGLALRIQNLRLGHDIDNYTSHEIFALLYGALVCAA